MQAVFRLGQVVLFIAGLYFFVHSFTSLITGIHTATGPARNGTLVGSLLAFATAAALF